MPSMRTAGRSYADGSGRLARSHGLAPSPAARQNSGMRCKPDVIGFRRWSAQRATSSAVDVLPTCYLEVSQPKARSKGGSSSAP